MTVFTTHISPLFLSLSHWCSVWLLNCSAPFRPPLHWICMMVWEFLTTSIKPTQSPIDRQPYGNILGEEGQETQREAELIRTAATDFILNKSRWLAGVATNLHSGMECRTWKYPAPVNVHLHLCCRGVVRSLPEIKALVLPDVLHYPNDLQRQHVLPQICGGTERRGGGWQ